MIRSTLTAAGLFAGRTHVRRGTEPRRIDIEILIGTFTDLSGVTAMWGVNNASP